MKKWTEKDIDKLKHLYSMHKSFDEIAKELGRTKSSVEHKSSKLKLKDSCEMGRKSFAINHGIDIENDMFTVKEFMDLTEDAFCGEVIRQLRESYEV